MFTMTNFILTLILFNAISISHQHPQTKAALKMLPPQKLASGETNLETDYFKPKKYTSKDFPRLIEGMGKQIRRDLDRAYSEMAIQAQHLQQVQARMENFGQMQVFLCLALVLFLGFILVAHCSLSKQFKRQCNVN